MDTGAMDTGARGTGARVAVEASTPAPGGMRAGDADRERVVERLRRAQSEGRLDLYEFDERTRRAWAAQTYDDLAVLVDDLPAERPRPAAGAPERPVPCAPDRGGVVGAWLVASLVNLVIWAMVSLSSGEAVYPWWIWVAGPWGAVLLAGWISGRVAVRGRA